MPAAPHQTTQRIRGVSDLHERIDSRSYLRNVLPPRGVTASTFSQQAGTRGAYTRRASTTIAGKTRRGAERVRSRPHTLGEYHPWPEYRARRAREVSEPTAPWDGGPCIRPFRSTERVPISLGSARLQIVKPATTGTAYPSLNRPRRHARTAGRDRHCGGLRVTGQRSLARAKRPSKARRPVRSRSHRSSPRHPPAIHSAAERTSLWVTKIT